MIALSAPLSLANLGLTDSEQQEIDHLCCSLFTVYHDQTDRTARDEVLRLYIALKLRIVNRGFRFGIINNRIFIGSGEVLIPFLLGNTLVVFRSTDEASKLMHAHRVLEGAIITDGLIIELTGFEGKVIDLESDLFELDLTR